MQFDFLKQFKKRTHNQCIKKRINKQAVKFYLHSPNVSITAPFVKMSVVNFNGYIYFSKDRWIEFWNKKQKSGTRVKIEKTSLLTSNLEILKTSLFS